MAIVLRDEIRKGLHPVGERFLSEHQVCARFGVSRFTAREALRRLEQAGLVERRQGSGTRVLALEADRRYAVTSGSGAEVLRYASDTVLVPRTRWRAATAPQRRDLELDPDRSWLAMDGLRLACAGGPSIGATTVVVDAALAAHVADLTGPITEPIFVRLATAIGAPVCRIDQEIYAATMTSRVARRLGADVGGPALGVIRRFSTEPTGCYEVSVTVHVADRFRYLLSMTDDGTGGLSP